MPWRHTLSYLNASVSLPPHRSSLPLEAIFRCLDLAGMETSAINQKMCVFSPIRRFFFPFLFYHFHPSTLSALAFCWLSDCVYFLLLYPHPLTYIHLCVAVGAPGEIFPHPKKSQLKIHLGNQRCLDVISL